MENSKTLLVTSLVSIAVGIAIGIFLPFAAVSGTEETIKLTSTPSDYVVLLDTDIRGLDQKTIEGFLTGKGLGQALPAELNGYPGPRHVIDMAEELELTDEQLATIQALFDHMVSNVVPFGEQYLEEYANLESAFRKGTISKEYLQSQLEKISAIEVQLRYSHLSTHLATIDILNEKQVMQYNMMRGYSAEMNHEEMDHSD